MKVLYTLVLLAVMSIVAVAQSESYLGAGLNITRSTNKVPDGSTFPGLYVEGGLGLPKSFQARFLLEANSEAQLPTIFTTDHPTRKVEGELRFRPEVRYYTHWVGKFRPFVSAGAEYYYQKFEEYPKPDPLPVPVPAYSSKKYDYNLPSSGLNPFVGFGAGYASHEAAFTKLLEDTTVLNPSRLSGYRLNYAYTHPLYERFSLKVGVEGDWVSFRETNGKGYVDPYYERDTVIKARIGLIFK